MTPIRMIEATVACEHGSLTPHWTAWINDEGNRIARHCEGGRQRLFPDPTDMIHALREAAGLPTFARPDPPKVVWEETLAQIADARCGNSTSTSPGEPPGSYPVLGR